jgi:glutamyl-tRNA reductase
MRVLCVGISHRTADVALRERVALDASGRARALRDLWARWPDAEFALVSTCNRTEVYTARPVHGHPREPELRDWLAGAGPAPGEAVGQALYTHADTQAVAHLFAVAAGLDSLVPGEAQIVSQLKDAYAAARQAGAARTVMNELFQAALHVAKHVRTETAIASGKVSVASVAVELAGQVLGSLSGLCVLSVGVGKMNELLLRQVRELRAGRILVANRSPARAEALADACGGQAVPLEDLAEALAAADLVVTATGSPEPVITRDLAAGAVARRGGRPMVIVDIAVPRDVEPAVGQLPGVRLYDMDALGGLARSALAARGDQREPAEAIIREHVAELAARLNIRQIAPTIRALHRRAGQIADEELADAKNKLCDHADAELDLAVLRRALHRTVRRILHPVASQLRAGASDPDEARTIRLLRQLFGLEEQDEG